MSYSALAKHNSPEEIRKHDVASIFNYIIARLSNCFLKGVPIMRLSTAIGAVPKRMDSTSLLPTNLTM